MNRDNQDIGDEEDLQYSAAIVVAEASCESVGLYIRKFEDAVTARSRFSDSAFASLMKVLNMTDLAACSECDDLLREIGISEFSFSKSQRSELVAAVVFLYPQFERDLSRMSALATIIALQGPAIASITLLNLFRHMKEKELPVAELVWELLPLASDPSVDKLTQIQIRDSLPKMTR